MNALTRTDRTSRLARTVVVAGLALAASWLTGCYVVPVQPTGQLVNVPSPAAMPATPQVAQLTARLYPANEQAKRYGVVNGMVTNDLGGHGTFSAVIGNERFSGEATRQAGSHREGTANGAGERGNYITCRYRMNSSTLGSGQCRLSDGAEFAMHVGG